MGSLLFWSLPLRNVLVYLCANASAQICDPRYLQAPLAEDESGGQDLLEWLVPFCFIQ